MFLTANQLHAKRDSLLEQLSMKSGSGCRQNFSWSASRAVPSTLTAGHKKQCGGLWLTTLLRHTSTEEEVSYQAGYHVLVLIAGGAAASLRRSEGRCGRRDGEAGRRSPVRNPDGRRLFLFPPFSSRATCLLPPGAGGGGRLWRRVRLFRRDDALIRFAVLAASVDAHGVVAGLRGCPGDSTWDYSFQDFRDDEREIRSFR